MIDSTYIFDGTLSAAGVPNGAAITASRASTNSIDLMGTLNTTATGRDVGAAEPLEVHVAVTAAFATLTSLVISLQTSVDDSTWFTIMTSPVYPVAQLIQGAPVFRYRLPVNQELNSAAGVLKFPGRYLQLLYTVAGSDASTGAVFSYINAAKDRVEYLTYPANYTAAVAAGEI